MNKKQQNFLERLETARVLITSAKLLAEEMRDMGINGTTLQIIEELASMRPVSIARPASLKTVRRTLTRFIPELDKIRGDSDFQGTLTLTVERVPINIGAVKPLACLLNRGRERKPAPKTTMAKAFAKAEAEAKAKAKAEAEAKAKAKAKAKKAKAKADKANKGSED